LHLRYQVLNLKEVSGQIEIKERDVEVDTSTDGDDPSLLIFCRTIEVMYAVNPDELASIIILGFNRYNRYLNSDSP
jgi:hypothetical protein